MNLSRPFAAVLGSVLIIGLAACADGPTTAPEEAPESVVVTTSAPTPTDAPAPTESGSDVGAEHNDADVIFAQMMTIHHEGALEMSQRAVDKAGSDDVRDLAVTIEDAQGPEMDLMQSWLTAWGEPLEASGHAGMDHGGMDMNGLSQEQVMAELQSLTGPEFDKQFLTAMISHHEGAVMMSEDELQEGHNPDALALAQRIIDAQESEIQLMEQLLKDL